LTARAVRDGRGARRNECVRCRPRRHAAPPSAPLNRSFRHGPLGPSQRDGRRRDQGRARSGARFRRGGAAPGLGEGTGRLRLCRRQEGRADDRRGALQGYGFLAEESPAVEGTDRSHRWIIDPLDGTTNFLHGIPIFAISIALERDGQIVAGVIFNPVMDELYVAERGGGAFMNERRLRVAQRSALPDCVIATGIPHLGKPGHPAYVKKLAAVMMETAGVRRAGAAALDLAWVASGRYDGFWEAGLKPWDIAAGMLLVREAGGFVSDLSGGDRMIETGDICAGNEAVQRRLLATLSKA
jgi:myo-inositol-1(or 4)-monophosphatase